MGTARSIRAKKSGTGATTITNAGLHRKTVYFDDDEWKAIRQRAFEDDRSYTDIVREAVRRLLGLRTRS
jgi:hypothetical protein